MTIMQRGHMLGLVPIKRHGMKQTEWSVWGPFLKTCKHQLKFQIIDKSPKPSCKGDNNIVHMVYSHHSGKYFLLLYHPKEEVIQHM